MTAPPSRRFRPQCERGSAMLTALCLALVFAICLSSYITLTYQALTLGTRAIMEAHAREVAEAGLELALYTANNETSWPSWTTGSGTATATFTMTASGLVLSANNPVPLNFGNGSHATVTVTVTGTATSAPVFSSYATVTLPNALSVSRKLTATASASPVFVNALAATTGAVSFRSAGTVDSYNSASGAYSAATAGYAAPVISQASSASATVSINNAQVSGFVSGYSSVSPNTTNWLSYAGAGKVVGANSGTTFIDSNRVITNPQAYQPQFSETPQGATTTLSIDLIGVQVLTLGIPGSTVVSNYYILGDVYIGFLAQLQIVGPTALYVTGNFYFNPLGGDTAEIVFWDVLGNIPSLEVHMLGTGSGSTGNVTVNGAPLSSTPFLESYLSASPGTPTPKRLVFLGLNDSGGTVTIGTTSPLFADFYFPKAPIILNNNNTIYGSLVGSSITVNGSPALHYDVALRTPTTNTYDAAFHAFVAPLSLGAIAESTGP